MNSKKISVEGDGNNSKKFDILKISVALTFCFEHDYPITKQGLIYIGEKEGWVFLMNNHLFVRKDLLLKHIKEIKTKVPWGWVPVSSLYYLAKNKSDFYRTLNKSEVVIKAFGRERRRYVKERVVKKIFKEYRKSNFIAKEKKIDYSTLL